MEGACKLARDGGQQRRPLSVRGRGGETESLHPFGARCTSIFGPLASDRLEPAHRRLLLSDRSDLCTRRHIGAQRLPSPRR